MTLLDQGRSHVGQRFPSEGSQEQREDASRHINVGQGERAISIAGGALLVLLGISRRSLPGVLIAGAGAALIGRGATGHCPAYAALGYDTAHEHDMGWQEQEEEISQRGIHVEQAFLIGKPAEELYQFWRNFENLPRFMTHLKEVRILDGGRSHWVATAPRIAGGQVEWDAEITRDVPSELIAWRSLPGSDVDHVGQIRFNKAMGDRGTEVHVFMDYVPPAGKLGHWIATLFGEAPRRQMRDDLRNFKRLMETGEIPTIEGQPVGTCTGVGERYSE